MPSSYRPSPGPGSARKDQALADLAGFEDETRQRDQARILPPSSRPELGEGADTAIADLEARMLKA